MSLLTLPLIFINLGGEMLYILDQRLSAQHLKEQRIQRILRDIIGQMLNDKFVNELFSPQPVYKKREMKYVFEKLAHASIMKLNASSMSKLYDLMVMAFKYQLLHCREPRDILLVTYNHLDAMYTWCIGSKEHEQLLETTKLKILQTYGNLNTSKLQAVRLSLLTFLQDVHIRVSIFLRDHVQLPSGRFILLPEGEIVQPYDIPGVIKSYKNGSETSRTFFHTPGKYSITKDIGSLAVRGDRAITYGVNMYATARALKTETPLTRSILVSEEKCTIIPPYKDAVVTPAVIPVEVGQAAKELNALARLIGVGNGVSEADTFRLTLFDDFEDEAFSTHNLLMENYNDFDIRIVPKQKDESHLNQIKREFTIPDVVTADSCKDSEDMLQLMDAIL
ncbi:Protein OSCP1 [Oopsacas minuta]|uniref:Protein OSCP1 n=1 Tax=Oopsacas minuta TaxID=111878 RepID=A0AAV7JTG4_9METZ|nr:Protein OSCP1 [Oopsacas minuta]